MAQTSDAPTHAPARLDDALRSIDVRIGRARRLGLGADGLLPLSDATLVYVIGGEITGDALGRGCTVDLPDETATTAPGPRTLLAGDAFLTLGRRGTALESVSGADLMVLELAFDETAAVRGIPDFVFVTGFAQAEPAAAALAANLGAEPVPGTGDPLICRMMAQTVLLSLIRAWARKGCAPDDWLAAPRDAFLQRVVDAVHADPGREWTVEQLAALGAMSRSSFAERFRAAIGRSPAGYVAEVRMREAKRMLAEGLSVSAVSRALGYGSDEGFSRAFRRHTGLTPSAWRAERPVAA